MRVHHCCLLLLIVLQLTCTNAASVQWDWAHCERFVGNSWVLGASNDGDAVVYDSSLMIRAAIMGGGGSLSSSQFGDMGTATWILSAFGDVVSAEAFNDASNVFYSQQFGKGSVQRSVGVNVEEAIYLSVKVEGYDWDRYFAEDEYVLTGDVRYGWVALCADQAGNLSMLSSAIDLDGDGIIVGGGSIPEPSSGVLMLLGLASLGLKRKRGV